MFAKASSFIAYAEDNCPSSDEQENHAGEPRFVNHAVKPIKKRDCDKDAISDPDSIFDEESSWSAGWSDEFLEELANKRNWADYAPDSSKKDERERDKRPPKCPCKNGARVLG